ncbi:MAG: L-seryl-tRNA(Sec) selenium transferase [Planctomycetota bacterium]|jgi:L-seryl-tRNA(Ser) seleniumtransferase
MIKPDPNTVLRRIPSLDAFLRRDRFQSLPRPLVQRVSRRFLEEVRTKVLGGEIEAPQVDSLFGSAQAEAEVVARCESAQARRHRRVLNATGIVLHTGLGRAPMAAAAGHALADAAGYAIVEVDPVSGKRNQREEVVAALLQDAVGVSGALVVNNNAGATTLCLTTMAKGREVVVSRGELVEIGGGFRMPDVMGQAGCRMVEVGTTNRTHLRDYERAITENTAVLLKVHTSNFRVEGFHTAPSLEELTELAHERGLRAMEDLGSGLLHDGPIPGLEDEPRVQESVGSGADLVWFSGDKLLGGPQCGIIVGDAAQVAQVRAHPLYRALRCDKTVLAALEATLTIYRDGDPLREIPTLRALAATPAELRARAEELLSHLPADAPGCAGAEIIESQSFAGSGANPARPLPSFAVALPGGEPVCDQLRFGSGTPIFAHIQKDRVLLDLRSLDGEDLETVGGLVRAKLAGGAT